MQCRFAAFFFKFWNVWNSDLSFQSSEIPFEVELRTQFRVGLCEYSNKHLFRMLFETRKNRTWQEPAMKNDRWSTGPGFFGPTTNDDEWFPHWIRFEPSWIIEYVDLWHWFMLQHAFATLCMDWRIFFTVAVIVDSSRSLKHEKISMTTVQLFIHWRTVSFVTRYAIMHVNIWLTGQIQQRNGQKTTLVPLQFRRHWANRIKYSFNCETTATKCSETPSRTRKESLRTPPASQKIWKTLDNFADLKSIF